MNQKPKFVVKKHPDFRRFFASGIYGGHTPYEFKMVFYQEGYDGISEETISGKDRPVILQELQAEVTMSPEQAKVFLYWLDRHIKAYEKQFGIIPSPPKKVESERPQEGMYG